MNFEEYPSIATSATDRIFITVHVNCTQYMWLNATTVTLFMAIVRVMADEYSGTIVQRQPPAAQCHTAVTSHLTRRYSS